MMKILAMEKPMCSYNHSMMSNWKLAYLLHGGQRDNLVSANISGAES